MARKLTGRVHLAARPEDIERWKAEAKRERVTFSRWIRSRLDGQCVCKTTEPAKVPVVVPHESKVCSHRIPRGAYCKSCRAVRL